MDRSLVKVLAAGAAAAACSAGAVVAIGGTSWPALWGAPLVGMLLALCHATRTGVVDAMTTGAALGAALLCAGGGGGFALAGRLTGGIACGALTGLALPLVLKVTGAAQPDDEDAAPAAPPKKILILGGGFAGLYTAGYLEDLFAADRSVELTLISDTNAVLFTPMLAEVAGSSLEPTHISTPLRTSLLRTCVHKGHVTAIDLTAKSVTVAPVSVAGDEPPLKLSYDQLVMALGATSRTPSSKDGRGAGISAFSLDFKSLEDAIVIRNRVIEMFEAAEREVDPVVRKELLSFVVAGGGFAGVELAGSLNDFARSMLVDYPQLDAADVKVMLIHSRDRILPELSEPLAKYALERMTERGVIFLLKRRLMDATPNSVTLDPPETIPARTLVWTAGTGPNPLAKKCGFPVDERGAVTVEPTLAVSAMPGVWALGDVAAVVDAKTGKPCPPTAQFALREAKCLARNIHASLTGAPLKGFHFDSLGSMCVVGHQVACCELAIPFFPGKHLRFSGLLAWLMWRAIYVSKLPGMERKVRVLIDWVVELFFPRDVVQTLEIRRR